jgi:hypothetical protein
VLPASSPCLLRLIGVSMQNGNVSKLVRRGNSQHAPQVAPMHILAIQFGLVFRYLSGARVAVKVVGRVKCIFRILDWTTRQ